MADRKHALTFLLITVSLDMIGFGIIIPVMPQLIMHLAGGSVGTAAVYGGALGALYALMQLLCAPVMGNLSDRFGRRPVLLASLAAFAVDYACMTLAPSIGWLFIGRAVAGVCGASYVTAGAYIADVTPPQLRAKRFGLLGAAFGVGFVFGPALGGILGQVNVRLPFLAAALLALANLGYGYLVLPESLPLERRRPFSLRRANPIGALASLRRYPLVLGLMLAIFLFRIAHDANPSTWAYFTTEKFKWSTGEIGYSLAVVGVASALVQGALVGPLVARLGERWAIYLGFTVYALAFLGFAFAPTGLALCLCMLPMALGGIGGPALNGVLSHQVPADGQGELQGGLASLTGLTAIFAPLAMTRLFDEFTQPAHYFPGAAFLAAAVLTFGCVGVCALVLRGAAGR